jgi:hypothetical protein
MKDPGLFAMFGASLGLVSAHQVSASQLVAPTYRMLDFGESRKQSLSDI